MLESFSKDKIVIIGDILELGSHSIEIHKKIKGLLKDYDKVILVGNYVKNIVGKNFIYCSNALDTVKYLETSNLNDKVISWLSLAPAKILVVTVLILFSKLKSKYKEI